MTLKEINKTRYRKHLNYVIVAFIASLTILALLFGYLFISIFSTPEGDNFQYNLAGVISALLICGGILHKLKDSAFFTEIYYVWQLKQQQNLIYRKMKKIKQAANDNDLQAINILYFYYQSLKQVYTLDDNTLTLDKVNLAINTLEATANNLSLDLTLFNYKRELLSHY